MDAAPQPRGGPPGGPGGYPEDRGRDPYNRPRTDFGRTGGDFGRSGMGDYGRPSTQAYDRPGTQDYGRPPTRGGTEALTSMKRTEIALTGLKDLLRGSTFVEVRLVKPGKMGLPDQIQIQYTQTMEGNYPDWNETLRFVLRAEDGKGFTEEELVNSNITVYFSLFDRCLTTRKVAHTGEYETKVENKFLGSFHVGLVSILQNSPKMEGMIRVNRPLDLQGYDILTQGMFGFNYEKHKRD